MGAWGAGTFENDDASDWLYELEQSTGFDFVRTSLEATDGEYIEAPDGAAALAAGEIVAAALGRPAQELPDTAVSWLATQSGITSADRASAVAAIDRVTSDASELRELWEDSEDESWGAHVDDLRRRLLG